MNRRDALKSIALGSGVVVSSASIMSVLSLANANQNDTQTWAFLSHTQANQLKVMSAIIIPHSDEIPGASAVSIIPFLDLIYATVISEEEKTKFKKGMLAFNQYCKEEHGAMFIALSEAKQKNCLEKLYNLPDQKREQMLWKIDNNNPNAERDSEYFKYSFLYNLRAITLEAYMNSQLIGEKVLAYDQVPGNYEDIEFTTSTRSFSP
jgi:hypothetical protein